MKTMNDEKSCVLCSIREDLIGLANTYSETGVRINGVRFTYNVNGKCTQALLNYTEILDDLNKTE